MKLEHIALNITNSEEIKNFYQDILGMVEVKNFNLDIKLAKQFFDINNDTEVYLMQRDELLLELFINGRKINSEFAHVCIQVRNREEIVEKAINSSYKCICRKREHFDQIFISDKSGNIFEIKEINKT